MANSMRIETITPEKAENYLAKNISNRRLQKATIMYYARQMEKGEWVLNGDAIRFDTDGNLIDGQHRLQAAIVANIPLHTYVARGLDADTQLTIDLQRKRTAGDMLWMRGVVSGNQVAAIARMVDRWERGDRSMFGFSGNANILSPKEVVEEILRDPIYIDAAQWAGRQATRSLAPSRVTGTLYVLLMRQDPDIADEFLGALESGADLYEGHPVLTLRRYWANMQRKKSSFHTAVYLMAGVRAWNAFADGRNLGSISYKRAAIPEIMAPTDRCRERLTSGEASLEPDIESDSGKNEYPDPKTVKVVKISKAKKTASA